MKNNDGWIYLHKKMLNWGWYSDNNTKSVFLDFLLTASYEDTIWRGIPIKRGQVITGRNKLSQRLGINVQSLRTAIKRLKSTNEITTKSTNKYTIITVVNYDKYQTKKNELTHKSTNKLTNNQPTTNQQLTTSNKYNKYNKDNKERNKKEILTLQTPTNKFDKLDTLSEVVLKEIADQYAVPISFVMSKLDDLTNWHDSNPQKNYYKNYLSALKNWVKRDSIKIKEKQYERNSKISIINTRG